jgi:4-hydroxy-tetrahydrodipicolinate reductase
MGHALLSLLGDDARFELVHAVVAPDSPHDGQPVSACTTGSLRYAHDWTQAPPIDVIVDFSSPVALALALDHCLAHGTALVSGTTGVDAALEARLADAGQRVAILRAANFSLGVAVLARLLREAAAALPDWDLEIVEAHHARKVDAPSGTALALGRAAASARGQDFDAVADFARHGDTGARGKGAIGFASIRAGEIVGEHTAMLATQDERIELTHRAYDNTIFARGALQAAAWLACKPAGVYTVDDLIAAQR